MKCRHHVITHDVSFPYACTALGFRSRRLPSQEVLAASGQPCMAFEGRMGPAGGPPAKA
ncbi:MAG: hypothetical protein ACM31P_04300 [Actinomycetota bacterium]